MEFQSTWNVVDAFNISAKITMAIIRYLISIDDISMGLVATGCSF